MKLFIDASVALAAAGQKTGASRAIFDAAPAMDWVVQNWLVLPRLKVPQAQEFRQLLRQRMRKARR